MSEKTVSGNQKKYGSYALAHKMIQDAIDNKCPLQAIAIEESILSDRLWSALHSKPIESNFRYEILGEALRIWKDEDAKPAGNCHIVLDEKCDFTRNEIAQWNEQRNKLIHGIVKYRGSENHISAAKFTASAMKAAKIGLELVRMVENWSSRAKRKARKI